MQVVQKICREQGLEHDQKDRTNSVIRIYDGLIQAIILTFKNNLERDNKFELNDKPKKTVQN